MFQFAHPEALYLFIIIPLIVFLFSLSNRRKKRLLDEFGDKEIVEGLMLEHSSSRPVLKLVILLVSLSFFIMGLAGPEFGSKMQSKKRKGVEIMIALDVSNSMLAEDIQPNRLERAKQAITRLVDEMDNDRLGLVVFSGQAFTQLPITNDYVSAKMFLSGISTNVVPVPGTAIGAAINLAARSFSPDAKGDKAIILITDGENHEDNAVDAAKAARDKGIYVHAIGIGSPQGAPIPIGGSQNYLKDADGSVVVSKLDELTLQQIASAGDGVYIRANNAQLGLSKVFEEIKKMNKSELQTKVYSEYENQFQWPMGIALVLLVLELLILERKTKLSDKFRLFQVK
jgi:Ca-activated chloride channel family protein